MANVLVIDAHPDPDPARYCHALAESYAAGAQAGGHQVNRIALSALPLPPLLTREDWEHGTPTEPVRA
ncbi:MAG TPA: NAD(P)H-dependent oxidoreductase, partial [Hyphomicrobiaceae bacterium]|nr:NAD(P)H-dependent oxidoreductase [Hyphomicrobiaceae bacterium]